MGHFMQASLEIAPNTELYEPAWQKPDGWDNPVALQNIPCGHKLQVWFVVALFEKVPVSHDLHCLPSSVCIVPFGHSTHAVLYSLL